MQLVTETLKTYYYSYPVFEGTRTDTTDKNTIRLGKRIEFSQIQSNSRMENKITELHSI